ncbi:hypothetical protein GOODEAATRI_000923 [Goodea atripinnis]|uniref:Uncharacterized protein n=1 Tax=Goodea atripinnis TaxID=208336 RepID=A0ABV0P0D0_9TELE
MASSCHGSVLSLNSWSRPSRDQTSSVVPTRGKHSTMKLRSRELNLSPPTCPALALGFQVPVPGAQDLVDFSPVYRCLHIYTVLVTHPQHNHIIPGLGFTPEFPSLGSERRKTKSSRPFEAARLLNAHCLAEGQTGN